MNGWVDSFSIVILILCSSCLCSLHQPWRAPGGPHFTLCGHPRRDHHPCQHCWQGRGCPRCHVQSPVWEALQLDCKPHQYTPAARQKHMASSRGSGGLRRAVINPGVSEFARGSIWSSRVFFSKAPRSSTLKNVLGSRGAEVVVPARQMADGASTV